MAAGLSTLMIAASLIGSCAMRSTSTTSDADIPLGTVQRTNVQVRVTAMGELRSTKTGTIMTPPIAGGTLQIVHLLKTGTPVKAGDVVVDFDPSEQEYNLAQSRSDYEQAEEAIVKAKDDAEVQAAQDKTALLKARYAVRQAELDVSKNAIVSAIDAKKNQLALDEAHRALAQLQDDIKSHSALNQASIEVSEEKANKAKLAMTQAQKNIDDMQVKSPIDGLVVVLQNESASGGIYFGGMTLPDYQEGDQVRPGNAIAQVMDIGQMELVAKVSERDRGNIKVGQPVEVHVDGMPERAYQGTVKNIAGMTSGGFFDDDPSHKIDVTVNINHPDDRLRPDFGARVEIEGDQLQHVLCLPRQAVFEKDGKQIVYVRSGGSFEQQEIRVRDVTEGVAVIEGLKEGAQVALVDPVKQSKSAASPAAGPTPALGGGR
ncbi:MAG TPA: efflux RND transporter periplasmic adaptor subunit [Candidatus Acidoferrales bacterium]|nr:efflux RND transporter periplasmic adaptor subunit [Candidatus Acidoferrales bacterium]